MSSQLQRDLEAQQKTIKRQAKALQQIRELIDQALSNSVKSGDIQSSGMLKEILDDQLPASITRHRHVEAFIIPADLIRRLV